MTSFNYTVVQKHVSSVITTGLMLVVCKVTTYLAREGVAQQQLTFFPLFFFSSFLALAPVAGAHNCKIVGKL